MRFQLGYILSCQLAASSDEIRSLWVPPWRAEDKLIRDRQGNDQDDANGILKEVGCCGTRCSLHSQISVRIGKYRRLLRGSVRQGTLDAQGIWNEKALTGGLAPT